MAASLEIIAIPLCLLIIAGELDISVRAITIGVIGGHYGLPVWAGIAAALTFGVLEGLIKAGRSAPFSQC